MNNKDFGIKLTKLVSIAVRLLGIQEYVAAEDKNVAVLSFCDIFSLAILFRASMSSNLEEGPPNQPLLPLRRAARLLEANHS